MLLAHLRTLMVFRAPEINSAPPGAQVESAVCQQFVDGTLISRVRLPSGLVITPALNCSPSFDAVLVDPPGQSTNITWVLEELLLNWIETKVVSPLTPFLRT